MFRGYFWMSLLVYVNQTHLFWAFCWTELHKILVKNTFLIILQGCWTCGWMCSIDIKSIFIKPLIVLRVINFGNTDFGFVHWLQKLVFPNILFRFLSWNNLKGPSQPPSFLMPWKWFTLLGEAQWYCFSVSCVPEGMFDYLK